MAYKRIELDKASIDHQLLICDRVAAKLGDKPRLAMVDTYGCQQNEADSEHIRGYLSRMGYGFTENEHEADVVVINTCAIREHAEMRVLGNVGHLTHTKRENPNQIIAVCGCMVQQPHMAEKLKKSYPIVDIVFGPHDLWRFPELLEKKMQQKKRVYAVDASDGTVHEGIPQVRTHGVKAWLSIMYGCNNFCTYCVVPYVRGRERSRRPEEIVAEAKRLVAEGYKEITLLGQNVNSYGKDLGLDMDFADLLRMINDIEGEFVIRFMTSHPKDATEKLFKTMAECEKCAHQLHLPVQAGNSRVLQAMNRRYTREKYLSQVELARKYMPDIVLTTDIIVGFPGETEEDFEATLRMIDAVKYDMVFSFIYSPRTGTPAATMENQIPREVSAARMERLLALGDSISRERSDRFVGKTVRVLVEGPSKNNPEILTGRGAPVRPVHFAGDASLIGQLVNVKITGNETFCLTGELE